MWPKFYLCPVHGISYCLAVDLQRHTANRKQQGPGLGWNVGHLNLGFWLCHTQLQLSTFPPNTKHFVSCHINQPEPDFSILAGFVCLPPYRVPSSSTLINTTQSCLWWFCCFSQLLLRGYCLATSQEALLFSAFSSCRREEGALGVRMKLVRGRWDFFI